MTTPYCENLINWITSVLNQAESVLNWLKSINWFGWLNTYISEAESIINELRTDLQYFEATDCAEADTIISWVDTVVGWLVWILSWA